MSAPSNEQTPEADTCASGRASASPPPTPLLRILDANANRAGEGLRVIEEYARFVLDDPHLAGGWKTLRHDLQTALSEIPPAWRLAARATQSDVGVELTTPQEADRADARAVAAASAERVAQAFRCLEEYAKPLGGHLAGRIEQLRYRSYTLSAAMQLSDGSRQRLREARLYLLIDARESTAALEALARAALEAGVDVLQLREKRQPDRTVLQRARCLRQITRAMGKLLIINDRPDLAALADADGVHVGQDELPVAEARRILGPERLVGVSTHSLEQARQAVLDGANYLGCGPTFPSRTKAFTEFAGLPLLRQVSAEIQTPAFAIGGIDATNVSQVTAAGFSRIAVSGAILQASDPAAAARELKAQLLRVGAL